MFRSCIALLAFFLSFTLSRTTAPRLVFTLRESYTIDTAVASTFRPCQFTGNPTPSVSWTFGETELPTSSESGGVYYNPDDGTLMVERAGSDDSGVYTCTGTNTLGQTRSATTEIIFVRTTVPWYISWYMWFLYAIALWGLTIFLFVGWFFYQKKKANENLPPGDEWIGN